MTETEQSDFVDTVEAVAIKHADTLATMSAKEQLRFVRHVMKTSKLVFAIWYDADTRHCYCIKGKNTPEGPRVRFTAIVVRSVADDLGLEAEWGDGIASYSAH
jgi:hypothetical protein